MHLRIKQKLIIAILGASVAATVAMGVASLFGFQRSFLDYLNEQGTARLDSIAPKVAQLYERGGSWDYLRQHPQQWFDILGIPGGPGPATPADIPPGNSPFATASIDVSGTALRITLLDERHRFLIGFPDFPPDALHRAVESRGRTIGWLVLVPLQQVSNLAERRVQRRQMVLTWVAGTLAIAAAALIAIVLSRALLTPIRNIAHAARRLAAGDYRTRVQKVSQDEIGLLAADVNCLAHALERTEAMRSNLMADISHEFRTPLAVLRAELEAIEDGVRTPSRESIKSLLAEVATLNKLVGDVHDLAIADLGALSYRRANVNLGEILRTCVAAFQGRFEQRGLQVRQDVAADALIVFADENRLQQLLNNLLENSTRYTDPGGTVLITLRRADRGALLVIEDSAPGVAADVLPHLFERFFRADVSRSRSTGGSGLGMAICRSIVEAHEGRIAAMQSPLGGLRIEVGLPLANTQEQWS